MTKMQGSIISGTMRDFDLARAFLSVLSALSGSDYRRIGTDYEIGDLMANGIWDDDSNEYWQSETAGYLVESLFDALDSLAPDGYYFGAHSGDGSDYGYWKIEMI